ncbi:MAG: undecaprenyl-phosphate alpha-N-acetylglucosaminyl 1-phosphate transferase, partial [Bacilli bacterium]
PVLILGVPIFDTFIAVIRRIVHKQPIVAPDKSHLHHRLLAMGFTHRGTVLLLYAFGMLFSMAAIAFESSTIWVTLTIIITLAVLLEIVIEVSGLVSEEYRPFIKLYRKVMGKDT